MSLFKQLRSYRDGACLLPRRQRTFMTPNPVTVEYTDRGPTRHCETSHWNTQLPILMSWVWRDWVILPWVRLTPTVIKFEKILKDFAMLFSIISKNNSK